MITFEFLMILKYWFRIKIEKKQDAVQLFSIKATCLSVKSGFQLHLQDKGIENLADIEVLAKDNGC